ncbi:hypothetical protein [Flavobacterium sp. JP2137]|uniref:hypothetical protein n=1 Tax=Flavobacterium sp. JP2137 TaxID=3414510 RepID=UPI003D2FFC0F
MRRLLVLLLFTGLLCPAFAQEKVYQLQGKSERSRIDTAAFKKLAADKLQGRNAIAQAFSTQRSGRDEVYFFIATFLGDSYDGTQKRFHDYLVLQVDPKTQRITDGYQYTLEWSDSPHVDLYRINNKTTLFRADLTLESLDFRCFSLGADDIRYLLNEGGTLAF